MFVQNPRVEIRPKFVAGIKLIFRVRMLSPVAVSDTSQSQKLHVNLLLLSTLSSYHGGIWHLPDTNANPSVRINEDASEGARERTSIFFPSNEICHSNAIRKLLIAVDNAS
jgi:hypothetical protein